MKSRIKQTEDHLSYTLLRWECGIDLKKEDTSYQVDVFSMVAEIGGYSGLLLGFSLMDTVSVFGHITKWILAPAKPAE